MDRMQRHHADTDKVAAHSGDECTTERDFETSLPAVIDGTADRSNGRFAVACLVAMLGQTLVVRRTECCAVISGPQPESVLEGKRKLAEMAKAVKLSR